MDWCLSAHAVSQDIVASLLDHQINDVEVEWRESALQTVGGPPLLSPVPIGSDDPTVGVREALTAQPGVPTATAARN